MGCIYSWEITHTETRNLTLALDNFMRGLGSSGLSTCMTVKTNTCVSENTFTNEAFNKIDKYNHGGFLKGSRTQDNLLVLNSLIEKTIVTG